MLPKGPSGKVKLAPKTKPTGSAKEVSVVSRSSSVLKLTSLIECQAGQSKAEGCQGQSSDKTCGEEGDNHEEGDNCEAYCCWEEGDSSEEGNHNQSCCSQEAEGCRCTCEEDIQ